MPGDRESVLLLPVGAERPLARITSAVDTPLPSSCGLPPIPFSNGSRGGGSFVSGIDAYWVSAFSTCSMALDGVSWVQSGSVEIAVGQTDRVLQNRRHHLLPPSGVAPSLVGALRDARGSPPWTPGTTAPQPSVWVVIGR